MLRCGQACSAFLLVVPSCEILCSRSGFTICHKMEQVSSSLGRFCGKLSHTLSQTVATVELSHDLLHGQRQIPHICCRNQCHTAANCRTCPTVALVELSQNCRIALSNCRTGSGELYGPTKTVGRRCSAIVYGCKPHETAVWDSLQLEW